MKWLSWFLKRGVKIPDSEHYEPPARSMAMPPGHSISDLRATVVREEPKPIALPKPVAALPPPNSGFSATSPHPPKEKNVNILQELGVAEKVSLEIVKDLPSFVAGNPIVVPVLTVATGKNAQTQLAFTVQKVNTEAPFQAGNVVSLFGQVFADVEEYVSGVPVVIPPFTIKLGSTIIQISASITRLTSAPPAAIPPVAAAA